VKLPFLWSNQSHKLLRTHSTQDWKQHPFNTFYLQPDYRSSTNTWNGRINLLWKWDWLHSHSTLLCTRRHFKWQKLFYSNKWIRICLQLTNKLVKLFESPPSAICKELADWLVTTLQEIIDTYKRQWGKWKDIINQDKFWSRYRETSDHFENSW